MLSRAFPIAVLVFVAVSQMASAGLAGLQARATPDPRYATVLSPRANTTVKLDGSSLLNLQYYGVGGDGYSTSQIRIYVADFNATHPDGYSNLSGDQRYGLEAYMTVPPNAFQPGSTESEITSHSFNAYNYSTLPLPRANVKTPFTATLSLLETYSAPNGGGLLRENRVAIPINIVPA